MRATCCRRFSKGSRFIAIAGPNVVRGYITQPDGAGYKAEIVNMIARREGQVVPPERCLRGS